MSSSLSVVVGGAFGSEAKGAVTARVARMTRRNRPNKDVHVIRVAGHNAGHTAYDETGQAWALRTVPVAAVVDPTITLHIAPGSEVNPAVLMQEVTDLEEAGIKVRDRLYISTAATWLDEDHIAEEGGRQMHERTGSTAKGVGAARAARVMRTAKQIGEWPDLVKYGIPTYQHDTVLRSLANDDVHVIIEGTQGYGLGVHTEYYPLTTSSDCRAIDFLAMAGLDPTAFDRYEVWVVMRRYPIRVAGPSGPLKGETSWEDLGLPEERTTVTKKVRRVGEWDEQLAYRAVEANGGPRVVKLAFTMADQAIPGLRDVDGPISDVITDLEADDRLALRSLIEMAEGDTGAVVHLIGTGPNSMIERAL